MTILELLNSIKKENQIVCGFDLLKRTNINCINDFAGIILGKNIINQSKDSNNKYIILDTNITNEIIECLYEDINNIDILTNNGHKTCYIYIENEDSNFEDFYCIINIDGEKLTTHDINTELSKNFINTIKDLANKNFDNLDFDYIHCFIDFCC